MAGAKDYSGVALIAPVTVPYVRFSDRTAAWWIGTALRDLLARAGLKKPDVDGLAVSSFTLAPDSVVGVTEHLGLEPRWLDQVPFGGASGIIAMRRAARAIQSRDAEVVACIAGDTNRKDGFKSLIQDFSVFSKDAVYPYGAPGPNGVFAMLTRAYMEQTGATREDFGRLAITQRAHAAAFPRALLRALMSMEDYLTARPIAEPLHLFDCVMPCAGAEAFIVTTVKRARSLKVPFVTIAGAIERHNAFANDPVQLRGGWAVDRDKLWAQANHKPTDIDFVETYDDYPVISMLQFEGLGLCREGKAPALVRSKSLRVGSALAHNTSGGQLSVGQAGAAGGYLGLVEALRQLTDTALGLQVKRAQLGLVSGYGMVNYDRGVCTAAAVLERGS